MIGVESTSLCDISRTDARMDLADPSFFLEESSFYCNFQY